MALWDTESQTSNFTLSTSNKWEMGGCSGILDDQRNVEVNIVIIHHHVKNMQSRPIG